MASPFSDLIVGVSNDAVNFLTSALGAKAAPLTTIMIVASIGVVVGAVASGGMMGIAKNTMFTPSLFSVQDLLFIYVVVMLTDVFLLDLFNSVRLPTSTTVSIVFELLGATLAISFLKVVGRRHAGKRLGDLPECRQSHQGDRRHLRVRRPGPSRQGGWYSGSCAR